MRGDRVAAIIALSMCLGSGALAAEVPEPMDLEAIKAEFARTQERIAELQKLLAAREQEEALNAQLRGPAAPSVRGASAVAIAPAPAAPAAPAPARATAGPSVPPAAERPAQPPAQPAATAQADPPKNNGGSSGGTPTGLNAFNFGAGLAFTYDLGDHDRVKSATVVNGIVRVTEEENVRGRLVLEGHYFFTPKGNFLGLEQGDWGVGPFVAVQGGATAVIEGIGGGVMLGLKRHKVNEQSTGGRSDKPDADSDASSFNLGLGVFYDLSVQTLGDGIVANQPLPEGETEIRFSKRSQSGFIVLSSFAF